MMKIAFVINAATHTSIPIEVANRLSETDQVTILSLYDDQQRAEEICGLVAPRCACRGFSFKKGKLRAIRVLKRELKEGGYDIVHTHHTLSGSLTRFLLRRRKHTKLLHTVHANHHSFSTKQNLIIGSTLSLCDCIIFNSRTTMNGLLDWQKRATKKVPGKVVYNGIDVGRIQNATKQAADSFCDAQGIGSDAFLFAQVGRLEKVKNPIATLKAFCRLVEAEPERNIRLLFIGDGSQRGALEEYIAAHPALEGRVVLAGTLPRDVVYSLMRRIDALVVPSLYEGFCNALFEGLAAGLPIIASDIEVFRELIDDSLGIRRFDPADPDQLAERMKELYRDPPDMQTRAAWKAEAFQKYDISKCIEGYRETYLHILSGG